MMTFAPNDHKHESSVIVRKSILSVDKFAETDIIDAVEPIELDKRLPFPEHAYGMYSLRRMWDKFWKGY